MPRHGAGARTRSDDDVDIPAPDLTPTGRVILGMISLGKCTGYDIKHFVDKSTRHFWAASYGQIYPELKRLEEQGLIRGAPEPTGDGLVSSTTSRKMGGRPSTRGWPPMRSRFTSCATRAC